MTSVCPRKRQVFKNDWNLDELDEDGFKSSQRPDLDSACKNLKTSKMSSILPDTRVESGSSAMAPAPAQELHIPEPAADAQSLADAQRDPNSLGGRPSVLDLRLQRHVAWLLEKGVLALIRRPSFFLCKQNHSQKHQKVIRPYKTTI